MGYIVYIETVQPSHRAHSLTIIILTVIIKPFKEQYTVSALTMMKRLTRRLSSTVEW